MKMVPFDRSYTISYWSVIVSIALSFTILNHLTLNNVVTLTGHSRSLKMEPLDTVPIDIPQ